MVMAGVGARRGAAAERKTLMRHRQSEGGAVTAGTKTKRVVPVDIAATWPGASRRSAEEAEAGAGGASEAQLVLRTRRG